MAKTSEELFNDWLLDSYSMRYLLIMIFTLLIPMLLGNSADACQYVPSNNTLQEDFEEHDFVFSGKILTVGKYVAYTPVTLEIIEQWKGEPHEKVYLFTCAGKNSGGLQFEEGKSYLIFAEKLANNEEPIVTDFGPTKLLSNAKKDILFLDQQAHNTRFTYEHEIEQKPNYQFIDFSYANKIGDPIQFILEKTAKNQCNSYTATITDENGDIVWTQQRGSLCVVADDSSLQTSQIKLGYDTNNPIIIDESGTYLIKVQIDDRNMEREFIVRQNHTGISLDSMTYPVPWNVESPLKQFKSGIPFVEIQCRDNLTLIQKYDGTPACVKHNNILDLIKRNWTTSEVLMNMPLVQLGKECGHYSHNEFLARMQNHALGDTCHDFIIMKALEDEKEMLEQGYLFDAEEQVWKKDGFPDTMISISYHYMVNLELENED